MPRSPPASCRASPNLSPYGLVPASPLHLAHRIEASQDAQSPLMLHTESPLFFSPSPPTHPPSYPHFAWAPPMDAFPLGDTEPAYPRAESAYPPAESAYPGLTSTNEEGAAGRGRDEQTWSVLETDVQGPLG